MKKLLASLVLVIATSALAAPTSTTAVDCEAMVSHARMWRLAEQEKQPPTKMISWVYIEYSQLVNSKQMTERRALKLIGMLLMAKEITDTIPKATLPELEKKVRIDCHKMFAVSM